MQNCLPVNRDGKEQRILGHTCPSSYPKEHSSLVLSCDHTRDELLTLARRPQAEMDYPEILDEVLRINEQLGFPLPKEILPRSPIVNM